MMKEKIKPCPFCGSKTVDICRTNENACWVRCARCWGEAPSNADRKVAIGLWNRRPKFDGFAKIGWDDNWDWTP